MNKMSLRWFYETCGYMCILSLVEFVKTDYNKYFDCLDMRTHLETSSVV